MRRTTLVIAALGMAVLVFATPLLAQGGPPSTDDRGPPDHAASESEPSKGPPDHAQAHGHTDDGTEATKSTTEPSDAEEPEQATQTDAEDDASDGQASEQPTETDGKMTSASGTDGTARASPTETDGEESQVPDETAIAAQPTQPAIEEADAESAAWATAEPREPQALASASADPSPMASGSSGTPTPTVPEEAQVAGWLTLLGLVGFGLVARTRVPEDPADGDDGGPEDVEEAEPETTSPPEEPQPEPEAAPVEFGLPTPGVTGVLTLGHQALERGEIEAAAGWFRTATRLDPAKQVAHFCLGLCLEDLDRLDEAEASLFRAHEMRPGDVEATYALAGVLARQGRTRRALGLLEGLIEDMPGLAERLQEDEAWATMRDHPRLLALTGELAMAGEEDPLVDTDLA